MTRGDHALASFLVLGALTSAAHAQSATAEVLFRDGRALVKAHRVAEGCAKLAASERIEPSVGTLLNLGDCREALGQRAAAWAAFEKAAAVAHRAGNDATREREAQRRAARLEPTLATLAILVASPVASEVVHRDGDVLDAATWGAAMPIDPGTYKLVAEAPGRVTWRGSITIDATTRHQVATVPQLANIPEPPELPPEPASAKPPVPHPTTAPRRVHRTWSATRGVAVAVGAAGVAGIAVGAGFGVRATERSGQADVRCPNTACSDPIGLGWASDARTDANRANVLYATGGIAIAAAAILWVIGRPEDELVIVPTAQGGNFGLAMVGAL